MVQYNEPYLLFQVFTDLNVGTSVPDVPTGYEPISRRCANLTGVKLCSWEASPNSQIAFNVPNNWKAGRIWVDHAILFYHQNTKIKFIGPSRL
jgi:hypothetical protein